MTWASYAAWTGVVVGASGKFGCLHGGRASWGSRSEVVLWVVVELGVTGALATAVGIKNNSTIEELVSKNLSTKEQQNLKLALSR